MNLCHKRVNESELDQQTWEIFVSQYTQVSLSQSATICSKLTKKHYKKVWNMFKLTKKDNDIVLVSLLKTFKIFYTLL